MKKIILLGLICVRSVVAATTPDGAEFTKLRLDYAKAPDAILGWVANDERKALVELFPADKKKFVEAGAKWLERCPVDAKVQLMMGAAMSDLGRSRDAIVYRYFHYGLMQSIVGALDGLSKDSAFKVISVDEEYTVCNFLGAEVAGQRLEGTFDVLSVEIRGVKRELYFDASIWFKVMQGKLSK
jgi:Domain of unknown function (DUF4919)